MVEEPGSETRISVTEIIIEALKGIKSEILLYAVAVVALLVGSAAFGLDVLKELKWPLILIFSVALVAYFIARAIPKARVQLKQRLKQRSESL
jgi:hypothetical protein